MNLYELPNGTLRNKLGITEQNILNQKEREITVFAETTLSNFPLNFDGLKQIHYHLFQDIYDWAGQTRISTLEKDKGTLPFIHPNFIPIHAKKIFSDFESKNQLKGLNKEYFIKEVSILFGEINNLHPFREGNGRTQRIFIEEVGKQAGYEINFHEITKERMIQASIEYREGNSKKMEELFTDILDENKNKNLQDVNKVLKEIFGIKFWNNQYIAHSHEGNIYKGIYIDQSSTSFLIQLDENNGIYPKNSIIVSNIEDLRFLDKKNPKEEEKIVLNIPYSKNQTYHLTFGFDSETKGFQMRINNQPADKFLVERPQVLNILKANPQLSAYSNEQLKSGLLPKIEDKRLISMTIDQNGKEIKSKDLER